VWFLYCALAEGPVRLGMFLSGMLLVELLSLPSP